MQWTKWVHEALWVPKVKVIHWPWSHSLRFNNLNFFSSITTWPIKAKLYVESPWDEGKKTFSNYLGHLTKMATIPIYGTKSSWPSAHTRVLPSLFKWCPRVDLDLFYCTINIGPVCFCHSWTLVQFNIFKLLFLNNSWFWHILRTQVSYTGPMVLWLIFVLRITSGSMVKVVDSKKCFNSHPQVVCATDCSKAVVPMVFLFCVALWFILRGASC